MYLGGFWTALTCVLLGLLFTTGSVNRTTPPVHFAGNARPSLFTMPTRAFHKADLDDSELFLRIAAALDDSDDSDEEELRSSILSSTGHVGVGCSPSGAAAAEVCQQLHRPLGAAAHALP